MRVSWGQTRRLPLGGLVLVQFIVNVIRRDTFKWGRLEGKKLCALCAKGAHMIIESHALWGEEPTEEYPATFTYLGAEPLPDKPNGRRPAVIICGGGGFTHIAPH